MGQPKFTISLLGFDERSAEFLSQETRMTMRVVDPISKNDTQVVVVDIDDPDGITLWDKFRKQWPHMPAVVTASDEPDIDDASFAEKPFTVEALIDCITEAIILSPSAEEISKEAGETVPEDEALELQPALEESTGTITEPEIGEGAPLVVPSDQLDEFSLEAIITGTAGSPSVEKILSDANEAAAEFDALDCQPEFESSTDAAAETEDVDEEVAHEDRHEAIEIMGGLELKEDTAEKNTVTNETAVIDTPVDGEESIDAPASEKEMPPLSEIAGGLAASSPTNSAISSRTLDTPNPDESFFDPDAHMIGLVLKGISKGEETGAIAKLACLLDRSIYIDARNKLVSSNLKDIHMRQISIAPLGKGESGLDTELEMIESKSLKELSGSEGSICSLETFVWELAILTSKGRAPIGTSIDQPTYLMQWPNFTRLMQIPNDMKVAAYWLRLPSSLLDLSSNLNVPINDIQLLYSAASLTGLAGIGKRKSDYMLRPGKPEKHKNRSLFGSIIDRLSKN